MAYLLRKVAIIGLIAMNSPVHGGKPAEADLARAVRQVASSVQADPRAASGSIAAAREAAQILAGLDPQTRERIVHVAASAATGRAVSR